MVDGTPGRGVIVGWIGGWRAWIEKDGGWLKAIRVQVPRLPIQVGRQGRKGWLGVEKNVEPGTWDLGRRAGRWWLWFGSR